MFPPRSPASGRHRLPVVLVVLSALLAMLGVFANWAERQVFDSDGWQGVSEELVDDALVQEAIARALSDRLADAVGPGLASRLGVPGADGVALRSGLRAATVQALERPAVQATLARALSDAHRTALTIARGEDERLAADETGTVVLDLGATLRSVADLLGVDGSAVGSGRFELARVDGLERVQTGLRVLGILAIGLPLAALGLLALALAGAGRRRAAALNLAGVAYIVGALLVEPLRRLIGRAVVDAVDPPAAYIPAADRTWELSSTMLREGAWIMGGAGALLLALGLVLGLRGRGRW